MVPVAFAGAASAAGALSAVSVIAPLCAALSMIGASLVPVIVIVMVRVAVPSNEATVRVWTALSPWARLWVAARVLSRVKVHAPLAAVKAKLP